MYLVETQLQISIVSCLKRYSCGCIRYSHIASAFRYIHLPKQYARYNHTTYVLNNTLIPPPPPCSFIIQIKLNVFRIYRIGMCLFDGFVSYRGVRLMDGTLIVNISAATTTTSTTKNKRFSVRSICYYIPVFCLVGFAFERLIEIG